MTPLGCTPPRIDHPAKFHIKVFIIALEKTSHAGIFDQLPQIADGEYEIHVIATELVRLEVWFFSSRRTNMAKRNYRPEEIVSKLRQEDVLIAHGSKIRDFVRTLPRRCACGFREAFALSFCRAELLRFAFVLVTSAFPQSSPVFSNRQMAFASAKPFMALMIDAEIDHGGVGRHFVDKRRARDELSASFSIT